jgi:hypothetical protein
MVRTRPRFWSRIIRQDVCWTSTNTFIPGSVSLKTNNQRQQTDNDQINK